MDNTVQQVNYDDVLKQDGEAIEAFIKNIYSKSVPPPQTPTKQDLSFWKIAGLESSLFSLSGVGGAILSAIRTGGLFYILEVKLMQKFSLPPLIGEIFGFGAMVTALLTFEGFLLGFGLSIGKKSGKEDVSKVGLVISMLTVIAAGVFSSFSIVNTGETADQVMSIVMALITGASAALVAFYSSENLGFTLNHVANRRNETLNSHQIAFRAWRDNAVDEYLSSAYNIRHKRSQKIYGGSNSVQNPVQIEQQDSRNLQNNSNLNPTESEAFKKRSKVEIAYEWIEKQYSKKKQLYTSREIVEGLKRSGQIISVGTVFTALSLFMVNRADDLLRDGVVTEEDIERAKGTINKQEKAKEEQRNIKSTEQLISDFITINGKFPEVENITSQTDENDETVIQKMLGFVVANENFLLENNILTQEQIEMAKRKNNQ